MIDKLKKILGLYDSIIIIGIENLSDKKKYFIGEVGFDNNNIELINYYGQIEHISEIDDLINRKLPIILLFTGKNIIYTNNYENIVNKSNKEQFYITNYQSDSKMFSAITRKDFFKEELKYIKDKDLILIDIFIGIISLCTVYNKLFTVNEIILNNIKLLYNNNGCSELLKTEENDNEYIRLINGEVTSIYELLLMSIGYFNYSENNKLININDNELLLKNRKEYYKNRKIKVINTTGFFLLALILLLTIAFKVYFKSKLNYLTVKTNNINIVKSKLDSLQNEFNNQQKILNLSGYNNPNYLSYYINEIVKLVHKDIKLQKVEVFPIENNEYENNEKYIKIDDRKLIISGITYSDGSFVKFTKDIDKLKWVDKLKIVKYEKNQKANTKFIIRIIIK